MGSKLSAAAARVVEGGWLAALVLVPVFFDPHTARTFDADKILLLRSVAVVIALGLIVWIIEEGRSAYTLAARPLWRVPVVRPMLLLTGAYGVSTVFSIAPRLSFWGGYFRCQGTYTWLSDVTIFCAIVLLARRREQIDRLVTTVLLASIPPAIYGLIQHLGRDPIDWSRSEAAASRIVSTLGNPIFLGGFMIMVVPLTLLRVIEQCASILPRGTTGESRRNSHSLFRATAYLLLLTAQLLAIVYSASRGPFIGLAAGLIVFFMACAAQYRRRWIPLTVAGVAALSTVSLIVFGLPDGRLGHLARIESSMEAGTGKVRVLIWQGATELLAAQPRRSIFGYGPETMVLAYEPFYPPGLAHYEGRIVTPDRAHNETFDALIMLGVVGCAAQIVLFASIFYFILRSLGMVESARQGNLLAGAMGVGGITGGVAPYVVDGSMRFCGVGLPAGIVAGVVAYLAACLILQFVATQPCPEPRRGRGAAPPAARSLRRTGAPKGRRPQARPYGLLLAALLAAIIAHFVEIQVGIATASTRLYLAVFAGLAVAIGVGSTEGEGTVPRSPLWKGRTLPSGSVSLHGALVGLILIVLTYEFSVPSLRPGAPGVVVLWLLLGTWVGGLILLGADSFISDSAPRRWLADLCGYSVISFALWLPFAAVHVAWINWRPLPGEPAAQRLEDVAAHVAHTVSILYLFVFFIIGVSALLNSRRDGAVAGALSRRPAALCVLYLMLLVGAFLTIITTNLNGARADAFAKLGASFERDGRLSEARVIYDAAQRLQPTEETYAISLGRVLMEQARAAPNAAPAERAAYLQQALAAVQRAQAANPLNPLHSRNLARVHRLWASQAIDPVEQSRHFGQCESYYQEATLQGPHNPDLWKEWATLYLEWHQPAKALAKLDRALRLDHDPDTERLIEQLKEKHAEAAPGDKAE